MWQQYLSGGTLLYPVLGKGYHLSGRGLVSVEGGGVPLKTRLAVTRQFLATGQVMPAVIAFLLLAANPISDHPARWRVLLSSTLSAAVGSAVTSFLLSGDPFLLNYTQPILHVALILAGLYGYWWTRNSLAGIGLLLCLALFVGNQWQNLQHSYAYSKHYTILGRYGNLCTERDAQRIRDLQSSTSPGKRLLVALENAYLLDFSRNPIWDLDVPGMVSPPPGIPVTDDPARFARFSRRERRTLVPSSSTSFPATVPVIRFSGIFRRQGSITSRFRADQNRSGIYGEVKSRQSFRGSGQFP